MKTLGIFIMSLFVCLSATFAQTTLTGKVISKKDGRPLMGAIVEVKGLSGVSTLTDANGLFKFTVPAEAKVLTVSAAGYKTKTEGLGQKTVFNFEMMVDPEAPVPAKVSGSKPNEKESPINTAKDSKKAEKAKLSKKSNVKGKNKE